jgi:hypothetical protein
MNGERRRPPAGGTVKKQRSAGNDALNTALNDLPPVEGCVSPGGSPGGSYMLRLTEPLATNVLVAHRPAGGPTRKSSKGGWTPEVSDRWHTPITHTGSVQC